MLMSKIDASGGIDTLCAQGPDDAPTFPRFQKDRVGAKRCHIKINSPSRSDGDLDGKGFDDLCVERGANCPIGVSIDDAVEIVSHYTPPRVAGCERRPLGFDTPGELPAIKLSILSDALLEGLLWQDP